MDDTSRVIPEISPNQGGWHLTFTNFWKCTYIRIGLVTYAKLLRGRGTIWSNQKKIYYGLQKGNSGIKPW